MSSACTFEDPYQLSGALPLANVPFLSHILFTDVEKQVQRPIWQFQVVDASKGRGRSGVATKSAGRVGLLHFVETEGLTVPNETSCHASTERSDEETMEGGQLPSRIQADETVDESDVPQLRSDTDASVGGGGASSRRERQGDDGVSFATKVAELERRFGEQLEVHLQLNGALAALDTVSRGVRNAITDDVVAATMIRHHQTAVHALNNHTVRPTCGHGVGGAAQHVHRPADTMSVGTVNATAVATARQPVPGANPVVATPSSRVGLSDRAVQRQTPPKTAPTPIVRPEPDVVAYTRKVLRPKAVVPTDASLLPPTMKSVSIAAGATVTHFDRDSPPVSASRTAWEIAQRSHHTDSVRLSSSMDASPTRDRLSSLPSQYSVQDSIATTLPRTESSSSLVRVSYVDRNLASSRRTMSVMTEEDITVTSDSGSSSPSIVRDESFLSASRSSSRRRDSVESMEWPPRSGSGSKSMHHLFDMFHKLCSRATNVLGSLGDPTLPPAAADNDKPSSNRVGSALTAHEAREDLHDVKRLQHFIRVLTDDVKGLEALRKARAAKEQLMIRAQKIASARRRMLRDKRATLADVEEEFDIVMSATQRRGRRGALQDDDIEDETIVDDFPFAFGSPSGGDMGDEIADDIDFDDNDGNMEFGDDIEDELDDNDIAEDFADQLPDGLEEDLLAATRLLEEEEDLAEYLVDHDVEDIIRSPPAQLRLIRYGGAKQQPTEDRHRSETNEAAATAHRPHSRGSHSSQSSFYSSVEDEEEVAEAERKKKMAHTASADLPWPIAAVEEDESLAHLTRHRLRDSVSSSAGSIRSTSSSIRTSVATGESGGPFRSSRPETEGGHHRRDSDLQSPLKRSLSRKLTGGNLKRSKSTLDRKQSTLPVVEPAVVVDESSDLQSSASSGDADVGSCHPFSTPYTSCTTVDSSVEIARMPRGMGARMADSDGQSRKFIDRQTWMETEKRRRKALRSIAPLHTFTELYDPCESTPSRPSSGSSHSSNTDAAPPKPFTTKAVGRQPAAQLQEGDLIAAARNGDESEASISISPMSMTSPAYPLKMLVPTDELQALPSQNISQRYATAGPMNRMTGEADSQTDKDDDDDDGSCSSAEQHLSPPRGIQVTPPPSAADAMRRNDAPIETPAHSIEWTGGRSGEQALQRTQVGGGGSTASVRDEFAMYRSAALKPDDDEVRIGVSPVPGDEEYLSAPPRDTAARRIDQQIAYDQDDLVALSTWKERQMASVRTLWPGQAGEPILDTPAGEGGRTGPTEQGDEEAQWAEEATSHWAALEAMLAHRFAATRSPSDSDASQSASYSSRSSGSSYSVTSGRSGSCTSSDIDNSEHR